MRLARVIPLVTFKHALMTSITSNALRLIALENSYMCTCTLFTHVHARTRTRGCYNSEHM
jgi:hypothetical protein